MIKSKKIYLFAFFALFSAFSIAQKTCSDKLKYAKELFEFGQIEKIPELLDSCLINNGLGKNEEKQAYRLLVQTYLFDYNRDKAMEVMFRFLKKYPEYAISSSDPSEIRDFSDIYKVNPSWGLGFYGGANLSQVKSIQNYSVFNLNTLDSKYTPKVGYAAGLFIEKYFASHLTLSLGFNIKVVNYQNIEDSRIQQASVSFKENSTWFSVPLSVSYNFGRSRFSPFVFCGTEIEYLYKSEGTSLFRVNQLNNDYLSQSSSETVLAYRNLFNYSAIGGLGLRLKVPKGYLKFWVGYNYLISDYIKSNKRYDNVNNILNYMHIDDDIMLNHFFAAFTYTHILYRITKKAEHVTN